MAFLSTFIFTFLNLFSFFSLISSTATISSFPSLNQKLGNPYALWRDTNNILYVADQRHVVWKMDSSNIVTAFAGQFGNGGHSGDGGPATSAQLRYPRSMWNDNFNFYVAEEVNNDVRVISLSTGIIHTFAGAGSTYPSTYKSAGNILLASNAAFEAAVAGLWGDSEGNIYVGSALYVYVINSSGYISILAGNPNGSPSSNLATEVKLQNNFFIVGDNLGNIYVSDYWNNVVRKMNIATGNSEVIVGQVQVQGYNSWTEGIDGTSFQMNTGLGLWLAPDETLYIADSGSNIVFAYLPATGKLHLVAGQMWSSGGTGRDDSATSYGDGGPATSANIVPYGLSGDTLGNIYIADYFHSAVRVVSSLPVTQSPTASPTIAHQLCSDGGYCDGDTIAIRGYYTGAEDCAAACLQHDSSFEYFDLTTNNQCWCGMSCSSFVSFDTSSYSMNGGWCPTSSPSETPSVAPTISLNPTEFPTEIPSDYPTITPSETPTVTPSLSPTAFPTVNPTTTPTETPTEIPSNSPTDSPSQLPTAAPSLIPTFSPTPEYSLCFSTGYCSGDTQALRGVFTTAGACSAACALVNPDFKYFDLTDSQQCWCGLSCDTVVTFSTRGYRMGGGVCPGGSRKSLRG